MEERKYQIGDIVKVRRDLTVGECYGGIRFRQDMEALLGQYAKVRDISGSNCVMLCTEGGMYWYSTKMLEQVSQFKVGDIVKVRDDLKIGSVYGNNGFVDGMKENKGGIFRIIKLGKSGNTISSLSGEMQRFEYTDEMLLPHLIEDTPKDTQSCKYCTGEEPIMCGDIFNEDRSEEENHQIVFAILEIKDGVLRDRHNQMSATDYTKKINYCPMCGRKL